MIKAKGFHFILIPLLIINCLVSNVTHVEAASAGTLYSIQSETPIIDGFIDPLEWQDAQPKTHTLYKENNQFETREIVLYSMYDTSDFLFIAVEINETYLSYNELMVFFQTNKTHPIVTSMDTWFGVNYSSGQDVKWLGSGNVSNDMYTEIEGITADENHFGTNDFDGNCTLQAEKISWEMVLPMNSGDVIGHDVNLKVGDSINIFLAYEAFGDYLQFRNYDLEWEYCVLQIGLPSSTSISWLPITIVILGLFAISFVSIFTKRRK